MAALDLINKMYGYYGQETADITHYQVLINKLSITESKPVIKQGDTVEVSPIATVVTPDSDSSCGGAGYFGSLTMALSEGDEEQRCTPTQGMEFISP